MKSFIGFSKKEVLEELGDEFNFYQEKEWVYTLKKYWWGRKKRLHIEFDENNKVISQYITYSYGK
ncbi:MULTISPECIES: hypothetical protein [Empedobacter]|uniref:hypothetical protein n=1 Tax=Empedobacter TaxID=59734 RepID=UPI0025779937|nr:MULTISPECIES: hypothetical protein [Empedobacter]MDM1042745.1 hypothetical protein [Empedobacter brevis]MDM1136675.1 hypothetical protein [Empedobacter sp. R750]